MAYFVVFKVQRMRKAASRRREAIQMLERLRNGIAIVEGKHDALVLERLGIPSFTYDSVINGSVSVCSHEIFILMDNDRRGSEKRERLGSFLLEKGLKADNKFGIRLLKMFNSVCIEEIYSPILQALKIEPEMENGDYDGKDVFGYSKVHGRG